MVRGIMGKVEIRCWGVRGAIATPGKATAGVGGNTSCIEVRCGKTLIIFDAGTGIWQLGRKLAQKTRSIRASIIFSHVHLDHTVGLPFFLSNFDRRSRILLAGPKLLTPSFQAAINMALSPPSFPVQLADIPPTLRYRSVGPAAFFIDRVKVIPHVLHHTGGSLGYRLNFPSGKSLVYATDSEPKSKMHFQSMSRWMKGSDLLIHDAQYLPEEYQRKIGWGHSPYTYPLELAAASDVKRVLLFHHSPSRDDPALHQLCDAARRYVRRQKMSLRCDLAVEGKTLSL